MQYGQNHHVHVASQAAGMVIINRQRQVLLVKEAQGNKAGLWHIPSGSVEAGELPIQAAKREVWEETGLSLIPHCYLDTFIGRFDDGELVKRHAWLAFFDGELPNPEMSEEIAAMKFVDQAEFDRLYQQNQIRMHHTKLMVELAWQYIDEHQ